MAYLTAGEPPVRTATRMAGFATRAARDARTPGQIDMAALQAQAEIIRRIIPPDSLPLTLDTTFSKETRED